MNVSSANPNQAIDLIMSGEVDCVGASRDKGSALMVLAAVSLVAAPQPVATGSVVAALPVLLGARHHGQSKNSGQE